MSRSIFILIGCLFALVTTSKAQITAGPMLGYNTEQEVGIWVQLDHEANVTLTWQEKTSGNKRSHTVHTSSEHDYIAQLIANNLTPGTTYIYMIDVDGKPVLDKSNGEFTTQPIWAYRMDPPAFSFAAGSCAYISDQPYDRPGRPYGGEYEIFEQIKKQEPSFMLWLGDNTYFREADWTSRSGIYYRHRHTRSEKALQGLLASCHHYAIWDDHDYGPNDSDHTYALKETALQAFDDYWMNNGTGLGSTEGNTGHFRWMDCEYFLLDNRWYRDPAHGDAMLGKQQLKWLIDALSTSKASFKFVAVGSQVLHSEAIFENFANYPKERQQLLDAIDQHKIRNVVFLTGDRHHSEISKITTPSGIIVHDITSSSLTSRAYDHSSEPNTNRVPDSMIGVRNFAKIDVSGKWRNRSIKVTYFDSSGKELYSYGFDEQKKEKK